MSKPNKDGWIRHRGGKCPVRAGTKVDYRMRTNKLGVLSTVEDCAKLRWSHGMGPGDIMAYRIHKPAEQPVIEPAERKCEGRSCEMPDAESHSKECLLDAAIDQGWAGPLQWRDRITEIDRTVEALEEERVSLVQRLEYEGFRLIERINASIADSMQAHEDMSDWRNWKAGDLILVNGDEYAADGVFMISNFDFDTDTTMPVYLDRCGWPEIESMKFHSRPSK